MIESYVSDSQEEHVSSAFYKKMLSKCGIFAVILFVMLMILVFFVHLGKKSWEKGLKKEIENVLQEKDLTQYVVGKNRKIDSIISTQAIFFENDASSQDRIYFALIRVPTLFGPQAAVYVYNKTREQVSFVGFANVPQKIEAKIIDASEKSQIEFWRNKIPCMMKEGE